MKKIIFVCHGNICRSPAAEWIMKNKLPKLGISNYFDICSRATSTDEIGNDIYPPIKRELFNKGIDFSIHSAKQITQKEYDDADYIFYMDSINKRYLDMMFNDTNIKCKPITYYTKEIEIIDDPWYNGQYQKVIEEISLCIDDIIKAIIRK